MTKAWNKLVKLCEPLLEMLVFYAFTDKLDSLYNAWKDMYFSSYSKTMKDKDGKMIQPTVEEIIKLLIDNKQAKTMAQVYQNLSLERLKPDKDRETINRIIGKAHHRNP